MDPVKFSVLLLNTITIFGIVESYAHPHILGQPILQSVNPSSGSYLQNFASSSSYFTRSRNPSYKVQPLYLPQPGPSPVPNVYQQSSPLPNTYLPTQTSSSPSPTPNVYRQPASSPAGPDPYQHQQQSQLQQSFPQAQHQQQQQPERVTKVTYLSSVATINTPKPAQHQQSSTPANLFYNYYEGVQTPSNIDVQYLKGVQSFKGTSNSPNALQNNNQILGYQHGNHLRLFNHHNTHGQQGQSQVPQQQNQDQSQLPHQFFQNQNAGGFVSFEDGKNTYLSSQQGISPQTQETVQNLPQINFQIEPQNLGQLNYFGSNQQFALNNQIVQGVQSQNDPQFFGGQQQQQEQNLQFPQSASQGQPQTPNLAEGLQYQQGFPPNLPPLQYNSLGAPPQHEQQSGSPGQSQFPYNPQQQQQQGQPQFPQGPQGFPQFPFNSQQGGTAGQGPPQFPFNPQFGGPPPFEPENGYNPNFRQTYPEPPYESEFINTPPLSPQDQSELDTYRAKIARRRPSQSPPNNNIQPLALRSGGTEEEDQAKRSETSIGDLLRQIDGRPVPPNCAYNALTKSYDGQDCIGIKKR